MPEHTGDGEIVQRELPICTFDDIAGRLKLAENALTDLEYRITVVRRELSEIRRLVQPGG